MTLAELAGQAYDWFESATRADSDKTFYRLKDGAPEWLSELVHSAHGDFLPDDWRYKTIMNALGAIHDAGDDADIGDVGSEFADSAVDVYTADRFQWLSSNLRRAGYCDDAQSEGLAEPETDIVSLAGMGQYMEASEVFDYVQRSLEDRLAELEDGDDA